MLAGHQKIHRGNAWQSNILKYKHRNGYLETHGK
jgi:hypothetical protein